MHITRMWFSENERIGFMTCTPAGYRLLNLAGWIGIAGWVLFLLLLATFIAAAMTRLFEFPALWLFGLPLSCGVISWLLESQARSLAGRKQFEYHYPPDYAAWREGDTRKFYPPGRDRHA